MRPLVQPLRPFRTTPKIATYVNGSSVNMTASQLSMLRSIWTALERKHLELILGKSAGMLQRSIDRASIGARPMRNRPMLGLPM